jgi:serine/threonine-protein kinase
VSGSGEREGGGYAETLASSDHGTGKPKSSGEMHLMPGTMVGEYRVEGMVGEGGMGQVYGAIHPVIGKRAAIKVLRRELCSDAEAIERFVMEARAVNQIGHPNIVDVFSFGALPDGRQYMVMEWLRGESLAQRIERAPPSLDETFEMLLGICTALAAAHEKNIVHRDLKPHNIFLVDVRGQRPMIKLLDFGLVKLMGNDDVRIERTRSGNLLGTPAYISPEQARGRGVDHRTDLYALGAIAFQMITGRLVFNEPSAMEMVVAHMHHQPPRLSDFAHGIPPSLDALVLGLLAKDANVRPTLADTMEVLGSLRPSVAGAAAFSSVSGLSSVARSAIGNAFDSSPHTPTPIPMPVPAAPRMEQSTISRAAGERRDVAPPPRRKSGVLFVGLAVAAAGVVAVVVVVMNRDDGGGATTGAAGSTTMTDAATPSAVAPVDAAADDDGTIAVLTDATPAIVAVDAAALTATATSDARKRDRKKPDARTSSTTGTGPGSAITKPPPDDDDGDGTIKVLPKKTPGAP